MNKKNYVPERIEPQVILNESGKVAIKICGLDYCNLKHYCRGYCRNHHAQYQRIGFVTPPIDYSKIEYGPCAFPGCWNRSKTKTGLQLCSGHLNQIHPSHQSYKGELSELKYAINAGYTENGRVCKVCNQEKPLEEFYDRNQWRTDGNHNAKATKCKTCYKVDSAYYQGIRTTKADGTDPLDLASNLEERNRRLAKHNRAKKNTNE